MPTRSAEGVRSAAAAVGAAAALWALIALPARATYGARTTADEPQYLLTALSLGEDLDLDISDEIEARRYEPFHEVTIDSQTVEREGGREVSPHDPLLPLLLAPGMRLGGWVGAKATLVVLGGVLASLLVWVAVVRFGAPTAVSSAVVLAFALAAPLSPYSTQVYPELPAALALVAGVALVTGPLGRAQLGGVVAVAAALPWLGVKYAPVAATLLAVLAASLWPSRRRELWVVLGLVGLAGALYLFSHRQVYGGWTPYAAGDHFQGGGELSVVGRAPDYLGRSRRLAGLWVDRSFGLAAWAPVFLLAVPALGALARRRPPGWIALLLPLGAGWATATWVALTMHGWWWPGRQVVVVVPCLVLAVAWWAGQRRSGRLLAGIAGAGVISAAMWLWLVVEVLAGQRTLIVDFAETSNPLYRLWRSVLPDGQAGSGSDFVGLAAWSVALCALGWVGWRSAAARGGDQLSPPTAG